ncbi:MAG: heliorhodopsin HeR [Candidatus Saccharimonadales bacterium]
MPKKTTAKAKSAKTTKSKISFDSLNKWNLIMAALHFVQGVAVIILSGASSLPVTTSYLTLDKLASQSGNPVLVAASRHLFDVNLAYLVAAFFFMSAIAHLVIATVYRKNYEADLKKGLNKARWIEYGISASTMMVAIAMLSGVYDLSSLLMIFALDFIMNMMGLVMEVHNQTTKKTNWLSYGIGCLAGIVPWFVFAIYVAGATSYGSGQVPSFVYWIYLSMFLFFMSFAVNMFLQYKKIGKWADYLYGERVYMILSLVAKSALAWQVFFGTLRP